MSRIEIFLCDKNSFFLKIISAFSFSLWLAGLIKMYIKNLKHGYHIIIYYLFVFVVDV